MDPQTPGSGGPRIDPTGRTVFYVGADLATSACEVFGETQVAPLCPRWRVGLIRPVVPLVLFDLTAAGSAMSIGALPSLADGSEPRAVTQAWARAIYEDDPTGGHVDGIRYRSAYNGGVALALWDCGGKVSVVSGPALPDGGASAGSVEQDFPLRHPAIFPRLLVAMAERRIAVQVIASADCVICST